MKDSRIRKAIAGDAQAINELVNKHKVLAYNVAFRILQNEEDAKDVTQDSFIKALENLDRFREESKFSTWLYRIVHNEALMLIRKRSKTIEEKDVDIPLSHMDDLSEDADEKYQALNQAIETLDFKERNIIDLYYLGEKSVKEIHQITGMSTSNVKVLLHRTREKLRKNIKYG